MKMKCNAVSCVSFRVMCARGARSEDTVITDKLLIYYRSVLSINNLILQMHGQVKIYRQKHANAMD